MSTTIKLDVTSNLNINTIGINALNEKLGVVGTLKFLEQFDNGGNGDYTKEKYLKEDVPMTKKEILEIFKSLSSK